MTLFGLNWVSLFWFSSRYFSCSLISATLVCLLPLYYRELLHDDYNDAMIDETDDLTFSDDEYLLEPERD